MTISSVSTTTYVAPSGTGISASRAAGWANTAVGLSSDAGVIVMLGGSAPTGDSASQLYSALANAGASKSSSLTLADLTSDDSASTSSADASSSSADASTGSDGTATGADATTSTTGTTGTSTTDPTGSTDVNANWSSILQAQPSLAPLVEQLSVQQGLVNTFA